MSHISKYNFLFSIFAFCILIGFNLPSCNGKSFSKCQLATELVDKGIPKDTVGIWLCIIGPIRDSSKVVFNEYYGLFSFGATWWCSKNSAKTQNGCHIDCDKLLDDDLTDDVSCALYLYKLGGYSQWGSSKADRCQTYDKVDVSDCF